MDPSDTYSFIDSKTREFLEINDLSVSVGRPPFTILDGYKKGVYTAREVEKKILKFYQDQKKKYV